MHGQLDSVTAKVHHKCYSKLKMSQSLVSGLEVISCGLRLEMSFTPDRHTNKDSGTDNNSLSALFSGNAFREK